MAKPLPANPVNILTLGRLLVHLAHLVPTGAAMPRAALEARVVRRVWLETLDELGWSEETVRALAAESWDETFAAFLRDAKPGGSA